MEVIFPVWRLNRINSHWAVTIMLIQLQASRSQRKPVESRKFCTREANVLGDLLVAVSPNTSDMSLNTLINEDKEGKA